MSDKCKTCSWTYCANRYQKTEEYEVPCADYNPEHTIDTNDMILKPEAKKVDVIEIIIDEMQCDFKCSQHRESHYDVDKCTCHKKTCINEVKQMQSRLNGYKVISDRLLKLSREKGLKIEQQAAEIRILRSAYNRQTQEIADLKTENKRLSAMIDVLTKGK